jgi:hypothetical protein
MKRAIDKGWWKFIFTIYGIIPRKQKKVLTITNTVAEPEWL